MEIVEGLELARVLVCVVFLVYASISDYRKREVSNMVWVWFAPLGFALTITQLMFFESTRLLQMYGLSVFVTLCFALLLFYVGAFGGADAKGLICLALTLPVYPERLFQPFFPEASPFSVLFPLLVFFNAVLIAALSVFYVIARNVSWKLLTGHKLFEGFEEEPAFKKLLTILSGYKIRLDKLEEKKFLYPLEDFEENKDLGVLRRKLLVFPQDEKREEILGRIVKFAGSEKSERYVWATPGLPMMIYIFSGFLVALFFGDLVWMFIVWIFG